MTLRGKLSSSWIGFGTPHPKNGLVEMRVLDPRRLRQGKYIAEIRL